LGSLELARDLLQSSEPTPWQDLRGSYDFRLGKGARAALIRHVTKHQQRPGERRRALREQRQRTGERRERGPSAGRTTGSAIRRSQLWLKGLLGPQLHLPTVPSPNAPSLLPGVGRTLPSVICGTEYGRTWHCELWSSTPSLLAN